MTTPLTAAQAAGVLGVSLRQMYDLAAPAGPVACYRIGRRVSFEPADIEEFKYSSRTARAPHGVDSIGDLSRAWCGHGADCAWLVKISPTAPGLKTPGETVPQGRSHRPWPGAQRLARASIRAQTTKDPRGPAIAGRTPGVCLEVRFSHF